MSANTMSSLDFGINNIDIALREQAIKVIEDFGLEPVQAIKLFLQEIAENKSLHFDFNAKKEAEKQEVARKKFLSAFARMTKIAEENGISEMSLEEINAEIAAVRKEA